MSAEEARCGRPRTPLAALPLTPAPAPAAPCAAYGSRAPTDAESLAALANESRPPPPPPLPTLSPLSRWYRRRLCGRASRPAPYRYAPLPPPAAAGLAEGSGIVPSSASSSPSPSPSSLSPSPSLLRSASDRPRCEPLRLPPGTVLPSPPPVPFSPSSPSSSLNWLPSPSVPDRAVPSPLVPRRRLPCTLRRCRSRWSGDDTWERPLLLLPKALLPPPVVAGETAAAAPAASPAARAGEVAGTPLPRCRRARVAGLPPGPPTGEPAGAAAGAEDAGDEIAAPLRAGEAPPAPAASAYPLLPAGPFDSAMPVKRAEGEARLPAVTPARSNVVPAAAAIPPAPGRGNTCAPAC
jgi:hypothetical protein